MVVKILNTYNTSRAIPVEQIDNFSVAAHEFAEGNTDLETLLLNLHSKGIESIACCAGHKEKINYHILL